MYSFENLATLLGIRQYIFSILTRIILKKKKKTVAFYLCLLKFWPCLVELINSILMYYLFSHSVMSDSLQHHGLQHARLPCLKFISIESVRPPNHLIFCRPLLLLLSVVPSFRVFSNESALRIRWPKYWSFNSTSVLSMNIQDWFPLGWAGFISL